MVTVIVGVVALGVGYWFGGWLANRHNAEARRKADMWDRRKRYEIHSTTKP